MAKTSAADAALKMIRKQRAALEEAPPERKPTEKEIIEGASSVANTRRASPKGQRRRGPGPYRVQLNVKLPYTLVQQIDELVVRNKHTLQGFVELALTEYVAKVLGELPRRGRAPGSKSKVNEDS
jgi:hypothetical protein